MTKGPLRFGRTARLFAFGTALIGLLLLEGASHLMIVLSNPFLTLPIVTRRALFEGQAEGLREILETARRDQIHPTLGWSYRAGYAAAGDTLNRAGMRSAKDYSTTPSDSVRRIAAFGDSFVYCTEVPNDACWSSQMESGWQVEVLNYGVGGYGTDQAFLRYLQEGRAYRPGTVLIGFVPVNLGRSVNRYRRFLSPLERPWFKPRFRLADGDLQLIPTPVATEADARLLLDNPERVIQFGEHDYWYEPPIYEHRLYRLSASYRLFVNVWIRLRRRYFDPNRLYEDGVFRTESDAFRLQTRLMVAFADSIAAAGAIPVFLFLPSRENVMSQRRGEPAIYTPLVARLEREGIAIVDPIEAFASSGVAYGDLFAPGDHYSAIGNGMLAEVVARALDVSVRER